MVKYGLGAAARSDCRKARASQHDCLEVLGTSPAIPQILFTIWMEPGDRQAGHLSSSNTLMPFCEKSVCVTVRRPSTCDIDSILNPDSLRTLCVGGLS